MAIRASFSIIGVVPAHFGKAREAIGFLPASSR